MSSGLKFLGSATTGLGGLSTKRTQTSDPVTGLIKKQQDQMDTVDARITKQVDDLNACIDYSQKALALRLQAADALLAKLESQQTVLDASLKSLDLLLFGKNTD